MGELNESNITTTDEDPIVILDEVRDRILRAITTLEGLAASVATRNTDGLHDLGLIQASSNEYLRLRGKIEGVRLALHYIEDEERMVRVHDHTPVLAPPSEPRYYDWRKVS